jgi:OHCU decarboxylase
MARGGGACVADGEHVLNAIERINALGRAAFVELLGTLYEHSLWVAERAFELRPFADEAALRDAMRAVVDAAGAKAQLKLIQAHPELAGEKLRARALTASSLVEQGSIGLDRLAETELAAWAALNAAYRERFGFPFVICVRLHSKDEIVAAMKRRLGGDVAAEDAEAIRQIHDVARLRLSDLIQRMERLGWHEALVRRDIALLADPAASWVKPRVGPGGERVYDVAIVGGGQSGLGACFALRREGVHNVVVLDENPEGQEGPWITYARMVTLRTPKHLTGVETGIPSLTYRAWYEAQFGAEAWEKLDKIPRADWMEYLRWLRAVLELPVRNEAKVVRIEPEGFGLFRVMLAGGDVVLARKVVLATGIQGGGEWHVPPFVSEALPAERYAHSSSVFDYSPWAGKRIGILGSGASAFDNAQHALGAGAAEVHVFARRRELQRVNPIRHMERSGLTKRYALLNDEEKYRALEHFLALNQPPTMDTFQRASAHPAFQLHLGAPWNGVRMDGDEVVVATPGGEHRFDFLVVSTGTVTDLGLRPELSAFADDIALWGDRMRADKPNALIDAHPYLGSGFQMTAKSGEGHGRLHGLFMFNYAALASLGLSAAALSGLRYALPRLAEGVASQLFLDDRDEVLRDYFAYDEPEFTLAFDGK